MAKLRVHSDRVEIELSTIEKALSFHRKDIVIRRSDITSAVITDEPWGWIRGVRSPGSLTPHTFAYGTWKFYGGKDFLLLRGRRRRAVVIDIDADADYSSAEAAAVVATDADDQAIDAGAGAADLPEAASSFDPSMENSPDDDELDHFSRIIISTEHATKLVTALRINEPVDFSIALPGKA